jgi:RHS repeat-associated protein
MSQQQLYHPFSSRPHTYGVRHWSYSAIATEPCRPTACVRERPCSHNGEGVSALIFNSEFYILNWSFTFSAKEKDVETGLSYFGSRYYSSDLSIWLSVDPMSDKYASLSPYVYCADNPVKLVDPNGEKVLPTSAFQNSAFNKVYQNLSQTNNTYKQIISGYQDDTHDFILDFSTEYGTVAGTNQMSYRKKGNLITHTTANSKYYRPVGGDQCEIAMAKTLLHEAIHAKDGLTQRKTPSHNGFDQASVLEGLIEYNSTYKLGYTNEELEILSWSGMQESEGYKEFIEHRAKMNGRTFDEEDNYVKVGITTLTYGGRLDE